MAPRESRASKRAGTQPAMKPKKLKSPAAHARNTSASNCWGPINRTCWSQCTDMTVADDDDDDGEYAVRANIRSETEKKNETSTRTCGGFPLQTSTHARPVAHPHHPTLLLAVVHSHTYNVYACTLNAHTARCVSAESAFRNDFVTAAAATVYYIRV